MVASGKVKIQIETNAEKASYDMKKLDKSLQDVKNSGQAAVSQNSALEGSMSALKGAATRLLGAYVGLKGIQAVTSYISSANEAFKVQERAILSLNNALMNSGSYTYEYSQHLQNLSNEIQSYSNYTLSAIEKSIALGQAYMGNVRMTDELIKATVDFAAATGKDLDSAFTLVGKSIGSSTNALGRYGIELGKNMTEEQKVIALQEQLGNKFAGTAEKMSDSSVQLQKAMTALSRSIGAVFNPAISAAEIALTRLAKKATSAVNQIRIANSEVSKLGVADLQTKLTQNAKKQKDINRLLNAPFLTQSKRNIETQNLNKLKAEQKEIYAQIAKIQQQEAKKAAQSQAKGFKMRDDDYIAPITSSRSKGSSKSTSSIKQAQDAYEQLQAKAQKARREVELVALKFGTSSPQVQTAFGNYKQLNEQLTKIGDIFKEEATSGAYEQLQLKITNLAESLKNLAASGGIGTEEFERLKQDYTVSTQQLADINKALTDKMGIDWDEMGKNAKNSLISGIVGSLRQGENAWQSFGNVAMNVLENIAVELLKNIELEQVLTGVKAAGKAFGGFFGLFAKHGMAIDNGVQKFASGGVVNQPTMFPMRSGMGLMGEAGAEAIMPLKRSANGDLGVQATRPNVNIYNQSGSQIETVERPNGDIDLFIKKVNNALANERTQAGFSQALQRNNSRGVQAS